MFSPKNNGFSAELLKAVREATAKGPAPRNPQEVEEAHKKAGTVPKTDNHKKLAALAPPHDKVTLADVLTGRGVSMKKEEFESVEEGVEDKLAAARAMNRMNNPTKPTGDKKAVPPRFERKVTNVRGKSYGNQPDDMKEELFTDAELEAISTAATKL